MDSKNKYQPKEIFAYIYLYAGYIFIYYYCIYWFECSTKPVGLFLCVVEALILYALYLLLNHLIIRLVTGHKILVLVETLLILAIIVQFVCYVSLWERYPLNR